MPGVRVYQLAKELKVQSALIVELLDRLGKEVHSDLSSIDDLTAGLVRERLAVALAVEKKKLLDEKRSEDDATPAASATPIEVEAPETAHEPAAAVAAPLESPVEAVAADPGHEPVPAPADAEAPKPAPVAAAPPVPAPREPGRPRVFAAKRLVPKMVPPREVWVDWASSWLRKPYCAA